MAEASARGLSDREYVSIFWSNDWAHQRYFGWSIVDSAPGLRVLRKRRGPISRYLVLVASRSLPLLSPAVSKARASSPLSDVIIHDFDGLYPQPPRFGGAQFHLAAPGERLLNVATFVVDLERSQDEWLAAMTADYRRKIRKAEASGVRVDVHERTSGAPIREFVGVYNAFAASRGIQRVNSATIAKMFEGRNATLLVSRRGDEILNYLLLYTAGAAALFMHGVSNTQANDGAGQYIHLQAMRHLKAKGVSWYDFGGVRATGEENGIYTFKQRFGGSFVGLGEEHRCSGRFVRAAEYLMKAVRRG